MFVRVKQIVVFHLSIAAAMLAGLIPGFDSYPSTVDKAAYQTLAERGKGTKDHKWQGDQLVKITSGKLTDAPKILTLRFAEDTASTFQSSPPSPVDYAVVLYELSQYDVDHIAIADPLFWKNEDVDSPMRQLGFASLLQEMSPFESVLLGAPVDRSLRKEAPTAALGATALPREQIEGDISALPAANKLPFSFPAKLPPQARLMPTHIDGQPDFLEGRKTELQIPLLIRWGDSVIPTFTMGLVIDLLGAKHSDIHVKLGTSIRLSDDKQITIDEFGYATVELTKEYSPLSLSASDLLLFEGEDRQPNQSIINQTDLALIVQADQLPGPLQASETQPHTHRGDLVAHAASYLANNSSVIKTKILSPAANWINLLLIANVSLIGAFLYGRSGGIRVFGYLLLFTGIAAVFCYLALKSGLWTPIAPPAVAALTCILTIPLLSWWKPAELPETDELETKPKKDSAPQLVELNPEDE